VADEERADARPMNQRAGGYPEVEKRAMAIAWTTEERKAMEKGSK
jgi:hypothetical protein